MGYFDGPDKIDEVEEMDEVEESEESGGFLDRLGEMVGKAIDGQKRKYDRTAEYSSRQSDEKLIRDFKNEHNIVKKTAMANELKSRGYGRIQ